jgi:glutamate decarboxylase
VKQICDALDEFQERTGLDIPVHVDGASGAFVAPFVDPQLEWDFRLPRVASINTSGHKYGLVHPGVGWVVWRDPEALPEDLIFWVSYLDDNMPTFALNLSRPGAQYYNFFRLGFEGYLAVQGYAREVATHLSARIEALGFPDNRTDLAALRVAVRRGFTHDTADLPVKDLKRQLPRLEKQAAPTQDGTTASSFHH